KKVIYLKRLQMGDIRLDTTLEPGAFRELTKTERKYCLSLKAKKNRHSDVSHQEIFTFLFVIFHLPRVGLLTSPLCAKMFKSRCAVRVVVPNSSAMSRVDTVSFSLM